MLACFRSIHMPSTLQLFLHRSCNSRIRTIDLRETSLRWANHASTLLRESTSVNRTVKTLLCRVPAHNTLQMWAYGAELGNIAILILVDSNGLGTGLEILSAFHVLL